MARAQVQVKALEFIQHTLVKEISELETRLVDLRRGAFERGIWTISSTLIAVSLGLWRLPEQRALAQAALVSAVALPPIYWGLYRKLAKPAMDWWARRDGQVEPPREARQRFDKKATNLVLLANGLVDQARRSRTQSTRLLFLAEGLYYLKRASFGMCRFFLDAEADTHLRVRRPTADPDRLTAYAVDIYRVRAMISLLSEVAHEIHSQLHQAPPLPEARELEADLDQVQSSYIIPLLGWLDDVD